MKPNVTISVRNLVEFLLKSGDIAPSGGSRSDMQEGTRLHRKLQKEAGADYVAEVRLSEKILYDSLTLTVQGIADGILDTPERLTVDEIKTVSVPLEYADEDYEPLHWAQAYCYAYLYKYVKGGFLCRKRKRPQETSTVGLPKAKSNIRLPTSYN
jgi:hypothetical protein